ncbi:MAG: tyrosinase family protein [Bacteroidota bacterium]
MSINIRINQFSSAGADYISLAPTICDIRVTDGVRRTVTLKNDTRNVGQIIFKEQLTDQITDELVLALPQSGRVTFYIAGKFDPATRRAVASKNDKDTSIVVLDDGQNEIGRHDLMIRVRKDGNTLDPPERDRFLSALVSLNQTGKFVDFQNMHTSLTDPEIHGRSSFLPWHRHYLLDLERSLQAIDPTVSLPYWRFDLRAPNIFNPDFMGVPLGNGRLTFNNTNPLINWRVNLLGRRNVRVRRRPFFNTATSSSPRIRNNQARTIALGSTFNRFSFMEGDPHSMAHVSFDGPINNPATAPADPLFFMLHNNVDRLWAVWQSGNSQRYNSTFTSSYPRQGTGRRNSTNLDLTVGNFTKDTMWPWDGDRSAPRPNTAPGGQFPSSPIRNQPGSVPILESTMDYQGQLSINNDLGYSYDDIPYVH